MKKPGVRFTAWHYPSRRGVTIRQLQLIAGLACSNNGSWRPMNYGLNSHRSASTQRDNHTAGRPHSLPRSEPSTRWRHGEALALPAQSVIAPTTGFWMDVRTRRRPRTLRVQFSIYRVLTLPVDAFTTTCQVIVMLHQSPGTRVRRDTR